MGKLFTNLKKRVAILTILCMMLTLAPSTAFAATVSDISGHWAQNTIQAWVDQGTIKGYPDGTFRPENNISRAEFTILVNGMFGYTKMAANTFTDVKADAWYANAIAIGIEAGYINGYPDGTFKPENPISREEVASIIMKINKLVANEAEANHFTDANTLVWSKGAVGACYLAGILKGYPDGSFKGKNYIKRGEAVVALDRSSKYIAPVVVVTPPAISRGGGGSTPVTVGTLTFGNLLISGAAVTTSGSAYLINEDWTTQSALTVTATGAGFETNTVYPLYVTIVVKGGTTITFLQDVTGSGLNTTRYIHNGVDGNNVNQYVNSGNLDILLDDVFSLWLSANKKVGDTVTVTIGTTVNATNQDITTLSMIVI